MVSLGKISGSLIAFAAILIGCAMLMTGIGGEQMLRNVRDGIRSHPPTGEIVVVEIDASSLKAISSWPWPRRYHAMLIDRLRMGGARSIAFDVDFSASTTGAEDKALADALARAGGAVILPTFRQALSSASTAFSENLPIPVLRDHAFLASVNIHPDNEGQVRKYVSGVETRRVINFTIDQSIDPSAIPRLSFVDVMNGRVPKAALTGKRVVIGATAIELGDRYAVPRHGVIPGVLIQAMAAETLLQGTTNPNLGGIPLLLLASIAVLLAARGKRNRVQIIWLMAAGMLVLTIPLVLEISRLASLEAVPALTALAVAVGGLGARAVLVAFHRNTLVDQDTQLPNARAFGRTALQPGQIVVAGRIARFGETQSVLGQAAAIELLRRAAERVALVAHNKAVFLMSEDAFVWVADTTDHGELDERIAALAALFRAPMQIGDRTIEVSIDCGAVIASAGDSRTAAARALVAADYAIERGLRWTWHNDSLGAEIDWKLALLSELDTALATGQIFVAYQPKADVKTGRITGAEALVRWQHPERGMIPPDHFIPVIEQAGRVKELSLFVLEESLTQLSTWLGMGLDMQIAVNLSTPLLDDPGFADHVAKAIRRADITPARLTLEITESAAMADPDRAIAAMERLRALGVHLSIDDYGTGQSTLTYLKRLPANEIKIDKSFVKDIADSRSDQILVRSTIELAHELGFKVVAEGIEDAACLALLRTMGCDTAQGWHIGKPMPGAALAALVAPADVIAA
jgi:diguanylate cyclase